jgi:hypothetical protein
LAYGLDLQQADYVRKSCRSFHYPSWTPHSSSYWTWPSAVSSGHKTIRDCPFYLVSSWILRRGSDSRYPSNCWGECPMDRPLSSSTTPRTIPSLGCCLPSQVEAIWPTSRAHHHCPRYRYRTQASSTTKRLILDGTSITPEWTQGALSWGGNCNWSYSLRRTSRRSCKSPPPHSDWPSAPPNSLLGPTSLSRFSKDSSPESLPSPSWPTSAGTLLRKTVILAARSRKSWNRSATGSEAVNPPAHCLGEYPAFTLFPRSRWTSSGWITTRKADE